MFKKPFNRKVGETRTCKHCSATFHTFKPIWKCTKCVNKSQKVIEELSIQRKNNILLTQELI